MKSSNSSAASQKPNAMFLDLRSGKTSGLWSETDGAFLGEYSRRNTSESPNVAVESTPFSILEANAPEKYSLSRKAGLGILRRAESRGKTLHPVLVEAINQTTL